MVIKTNLITSCVLRVTSPAFPLQKSLVLSHDKEWKLIGIRPEYSDQHDAVFLRGGQDGSLIILFVSDKTFCVSFVANAHTNFV